MPIIMTTDGGERALVRLMTLLSPAFPVGGFAYSGGLEGAVHDGYVHDAETLTTWLADLIRHGAWWNDLVLLAEAWRVHADEQRLKAVANLAEALAGSAERHLETMSLGEAFLAAAAAWPGSAPGGLDRVAAYPVAVGAVAAAQDLSLSACLAAYLHAVLSQSVSVAIRLGVLGQRAGVQVLAKLENLALETAQKSAHSTLDDLGAATVAADIALLRHETQHSRLFRS